MNFCRLQQTGPIIMVAANLQTPTHAPGPASRQQRSHPGAPGAVTGDAEARLPEGQQCGQGLCCWCQPAGPTAVGGHRRQAHASAITAQDRGQGGAGEGVQSRPDHPLSSHRIPTAYTWGAMGAVGLVWATDWRLILDWVPYVNGKFKKDD